MTPNIKTRERRVVRHTQGASASRQPPEVSFQVGVSCPEFHSTFQKYSVEGGWQEEVSPQQGAPRKHLSALATHVDIRGEGGFHSRDTSNAMSRENKEKKYTDSEK